MISQDDVSSDAQRSNGQFFYNGRRFVPLKYPNLNEMSQTSNVKLRNSTSKEFDKILGEQSK